MKRYLLHYVMEEPSNNFFGDDETNYGTIYINPEKYWQKNKSLCDYEIWQSDIDSGHHKEGTESDDAILEYLINELDLDEVSPWAFQAEVEDERDLLRIIEEIIESGRNVVMDKDFSRFMESVGE